MKAKDLKKLLENVPDDFIIILQKDGEGNGYSPLSDVGSENLGYVPNSTWSGEVRPLKLTKEYKKAGYTKEDVCEDGEPCIVMYPVS